MPPPGLAVLAAVPGISNGTAGALIKRFGSVESVLEAGPQEWAQVPGVGSVRAHAPAEALLSHDRHGRSVDETEALHQRVNGQ